MTAGSSARLRSDARVWDWLLVAAGVGLAIAGFAYRGSPPRVGSVVRAEFTLVPLDARSLSCASDRVYESYRCAYRIDGTPTAVERPIVPVVTVGREVYFAAGLFQDPALVEYLNGPGRRSQKRFTASCRIQLIERASDLRTRFRNEPFALAEPAWVANVLACRVNAPDRK
jgi:hypothetical protein